LGQRSLNATHSRKFVHSGQNVTWQVNQRRRSKVNTEPLVAARGAGERRKGHLQNGLEPTLVKFKRYECQQGENFKEQV